MADASVQAVQNVFNGAQRLNVLNSLFDLR